MEDTRQATGKQLFYLFTLTIKEHGFKTFKEWVAANNDGKMTVDEASKKIDAGKKAQEVAREANRTLYKRAWDEANKAAVEAFTKATPTPMVVTTTEGAPIETVMDGVCGFANCNTTDRKFMMWLSNTGNGRKNSYTGGYDFYPVGDGITMSQSMERKSAACSAMVRVLSTFGIKATSHSRMD
jgi:hypothetical protein